MKSAKLKLLTPCLSRGHLVLVRPLTTMGHKWLPNSEGASSYTNSNVAPYILPKSVRGELPTCQLRPFKDFIGTKYLMEGLVKIYSGAPELTY